MSRDFTFEGDGAIDVRIMSPADLAASRTWIDNWKRMLPCLVVTRGLLDAFPSAADEARTPQGVYASIYGSTARVIPP